MNKEKIKKLLGEVNAYADLISGKCPKAMNKVNSLKWNVKAVLEELDKPDEPAVPAEPVAEPATK